MCPMHCCLSFRVKSLLIAPRYSKASTPKYFSVNNVFSLPLASLVLISWRDSEQHDRSRDPLLIRSWALFHPKDKAWEGVLPGSVGWEQGCISCGTCSYPKLTEGHVLTSAYVKIFRTVTRNAENKGV